jgi:GNAT superfamily N-acetyltransferase
VRIELPIETERLVIRPLRLEDAEDLGEPAEWIQEKIDRFDRDDGMSLWAAVERESGRAVALAGLQWEDIDGRRELDLGCVVAADARLRGYATEASDAVVRAAFAAGLERITAMAYPDNRRRYTSWRSSGSRHTGRRSSRVGGTRSSSGTVSFRACPPARAVRA